MGHRILGSVAAAVLLASGLLSANDNLPDAKLADWKIGQTIVGDEIEKEDLEGKVVVIEYWGPG